MNYEKIYNNLIQKRLTNKIDSAICYCEQHHIKPASLYPDLKNDQTNIVALIAREHYVAHKLLVKIYKHSKGIDSKEYRCMLNALWYISHTARHKKFIKVLSKQVFDLTKLTKKSGKSSQNRKSKYKINKLQHETLQIAHDICNLVDYWKCDKIVIEDLNIKSSNKNIGKTKHQKRQFNRLCNNVWNRNLFVNKLKSLSLLCNFSLVEVNPCYTSLIGNIAYGDANTPDMVAASIEIARRGYKKFEKHWFYPQLTLRGIDEQWKQTLCGAKDWKELYCKIKKLEVKYRFQLRDYVQNAVLSKFYKNKHISLYQFV